MVRVEVTGERCRSPRECRRCLEMCPEFVFMTHPRKCRLPGRRAKDWVVVPVHLTLCTRCMVCVEACPQNAITVTLDAEDISR